MRDFIFFASVSLGFIISFLLGFVLRGALIYFDNKEFSVETSKPRVKTTHTPGRKISPMAALHVKERNKDGE